VSSNAPAAKPVQKDDARVICGQLRAAGYQAFFVGGCVRDLLLGRDPKDFDVATDASPEGVLRLFPEAGLVGAHFGVVLVRGVEVATFRSDAEYSDGRRPDAVRFVSDPKHDAERRDFTINALFLDPFTGQVLDFVGGREDLAARVVRAIGDPAARFEEDHLRLLRAVRFAARLGFSIEPVTFAAIRQMKALVKLVAVERVREELNQILVEGLCGLQLLGETGLLGEILPEVPFTDALRQRFERAEGDPLIVAWAALLLDTAPGAAAEIMKRLRFSIADLDAVVNLMASRGKMREIDAMQVSERKRFLRERWFADALTLHRLCGEAPPVLPQYTELELNPPRLLTGGDLIELGYPQGPLFSRILCELEDAQLEGSVGSREEALDWLRSRFRL
jgi:poly(A) polymerase